MEETYHGEQREYQTQPLSCLAKRSYAAANNGCNGNKLFLPFYSSVSTLNDLALASLDDILVAWQGLGIIAEHETCTKAAQHFQNLKGLPQSITDLKNCQEWGLHRGSFGSHYLW